MSFVLTFFALLAGRAFAVPVTIPNLGVAVDLPPQWNLAPSDPNSVEIFEARGVVVLVAGDQLRCGDDWADQTGELVFTDDRWVPDNWHRVMLLGGTEQDGTAFSHRMACFDHARGRLVALVMQQKSEQEHLSAIETRLPLLLDRLAGAMSRREQPTTSLEVPEVGKVDGLPGDWTLTPQKALRYRDRFGAVDVTVERADDCEAWMSNLAQVVFLSSAWSAQTGASALPSSFGMPVELGQGAATCTKAAKGSLVVSVNPVDDGRPHPSTFAAVAEGVEAIGRAAGVAVPQWPQRAPLPEAAAPPPPTASPLTMSRLGVMIERDSRWRVLTAANALGISKEKLEVLQYRTPDVDLVVHLYPAAGNGCEGFRAAPDGNEDPAGPLPASFGPIHRRKNFRNTWQGCAGTGPTSLIGSVTLRYGRIDAATRQEIDATLEAFRAAWIANGKR